MADPARWRDTDAKSAVAAAATAVGVKRQDIYRRIGEFSQLLAPVGLDCHTRGDPIRLVARAA